MWSFLNANVNPKALNVRALKSAADLNILMQQWYDQWNVCLIFWILAIYIISWPCVWQIKCINLQCPLLSWQNSYPLFTVKLVELCSLIKMLDVYKVLWHGVSNARNTTALYHDILQNDVLSQPYYKATCGFTGVVKYYDIIKICQTSQLH